MYRKLKAFTLVELIVVISIIAILMAILIPNLIIYVRGSRTAASNANSAQVYKFASSYITKAQVAGATMDGISDVVFTVVQPSSSEIDESFETTKIVTPEMFVKSMSVNISLVGVGAVFAVRLDENNYVVKAWWAESEFDHFIGSYPAAREPAENSNGDVLSGTVPATW